MKEVLSLALALVLCLCLSVPAMADGHELYVTYPNGESDAINGGSGDGWSYEDGVLTLNGAKDLSITISPNPTIVLAPGSKNTLVELIGGDLDYTNAITFKGSGELTIYNPKPDEYSKDFGCFYGIITDVTLEDGLTMTGGPQQGDSKALERKVVHTDPVNGFETYGYTAGSDPAKYIRIAPKDGASAPASPTGFADVPANSPFKAAIDWAVEKNITKGKTVTSFGPGDTCTISHILTFLYRAQNGPGTENERDAVTKWAKSLGIDAGNLDAPCTRATAVTYMWKAAGSPAPGKTASFADVPSGANYAAAVSWAVEQGVTNGTSATKFSPDATCTRGQIVTFLYRASQAGVL